VDSVAGCEAVEECRKARVTMLRNLDQKRSTRNLMYLMEGYWGWYEQNVCNDCAEEGKRAYREECEKFWDALPKIFWLKDWPILIESKREAEEGPDLDTPA
jgi:hypothetical protein